MALDDRFPSDPAMLLSFINTKLRDQYADGGLDALCDDMGVDRSDIVDTLGAAGFEYSPANNKFW